MQRTVSSTPEEKHSIASFFAGVGGIELGFEQTGEFSVVFANEFDKFAQKTFQSNFPTIFLETRDIREVESEEVPNIDIITGGFPCQAFSIAGYRKGFEDERGDLFFELLRIIKDKKPRVIFIENVKNMVSHDHGNTFKVIREALVLNGYSISWKVLNASEYGNIPQNRERIYIVGFLNKNDYYNFHFPEKIPLTTTLDDIINFNNKVDEIYHYNSQKQTFYNELEEKIISQSSIYQWRRQYVRENKSGLIPTLTANMGTGGHNVPLILSDHGIRKLTPRETFNAQGFPHHFNLPPLSNAQLYKQAGNSVVVPVINRIAQNIAKAIDQPIKEKFTLDLGKYSVVLIDLHTRFSGSTEEVFNAYTYDEAFEYTQQFEEISLLSDEDYIKLIKKNKSLKFFMIIPAD